MDLRGFQQGSVSVSASQAKSSKPGHVDGHHNAQTLRRIQPSLNATITSVIGRDRVVIDRDRVVIHAWVSLMNLRYL